MYTVILIYVRLGGLNIMDTVGLNIFRHGGLKII